MRDKAGPGGGGSDFAVQDVQAGPQWLRNAEDRTAKAEVVRSVEKILEPMAKVCAAGTDGLAVERVIPIVSVDEVAQREVTSRIAGSVTEATELPVRAHAQVRKTVNASFWELLGGSAALDANTFNIIAEVSSAILVVVDAGDTEGIVKLAAELQRWVGGTTENLPPICLISTSRAGDVVDTYTLAETLQLSFLRSRAWTSYTIGEFDEAMEWMYGCLEDPTMKSITLDFTEQSSSRLLTMVRELDAEVMPKIAKQLVDCISQQDTNVAQRAVADAPEVKSMETAAEQASLPVLDVRPKFGSGRELLDHGGYYEGSFRYWRRDGDGILVDVGRGERYKGQFRDEHPDGQGEKVWADESTYVGQWKRGKKDGEGTLSVPDGKVYTGQWKEGKRNGKGTQVFANKDVYKGQWANGVQHGKGTYEFISDGGRVSGHVDEWVISRSGDPVASRRGKGDGAV